LNPANVKMGKETEERIENPVTLTQKKYGGNKKSPGKGNGTRRCRGNEGVEVRKEISRGFAFTRKGLPSLTRERGRVQPSQQRVPKARGETKKGEPGGSRVSHPKPF